MARDDGPISFLLERQLQEIIGEESPQQITDGLLDPDNPINWGYAGGHPIGGNNLPATRIDRNFTASATTLGNVVGVNYGARANHLSGLCGLVYRVNYPPRVYVAFFFSIGELPTSPFSNIQVSGEDITSLPWVIQYETHVGSSSQAISTILNSAMASKSFVETYPGMAYIVLELNGASADLPNSLTVTADVLGRKVFDYRTSTWAESSNPALTMYDILTFDEVWLSKQASDIDTGASSTWNDAADHFDTVMADTTNRYEFNGRIVERDAIKALQIVGRHAFAEVHYRHDKLILKTLANRTPASTFIESGDWVKISRGREVPVQTIGNQIIINYTIGGTFTRSSDVIEPTAGVTNERPIEENFEGCYSKSHARRLGEKMRNHMEQERRQWNGQLPEAIVADVIPGDVIQAKFPEHDSAYTDVRVESMKEGDKGLVNISLTEYGATTDSTSTVAEDGTVDQGVLTNTEAPDAPTATDQVFGERGPWVDDGLTPDPDDFTSGWGSENNTPTITYVPGANDYTELKWAVAGLWDIYYDFDPGDAEFVLLTVSVRVVNRDTSNTQLAIWYRSGTSTPPTSLRWERELLYAPEGKWTRLSGLVRIPAADTVHRIAIYGNKIAATSTMELEVRRLHIVPISSILDLRRSIYELYERHEYTEDSNADQTVAAYQAIRELRGRIQVIAEVPQGEDEIEFLTATQGPLVGGVPVGGRASIEGELTYPPKMVALGLNGQRADFPDPTTQTWEEDSGVTRSPEVPLRRYVNTSGSTTKYLLCTLEDEEIAFISHLGNSIVTPWNRGYARIMFQNLSGVLNFDWNLIGLLEDAAWIEAYDTGTDIEVWMAIADGGIPSRLLGEKVLTSGITVPLAPMISSGTPTGTLVFDASDPESYSPNDHGWEDDTVWMNATTRAGSKDPTILQFQDDGSGSQGVIAYFFDKSNEEEVYLDWVVPSGYVEGTTIYPFAAWSPPDVETVSYSVKVGLEYTKANIDDAFGNTSFVYGTDTAIFGTAKQHRRVGLTSISGTGLERKAIFKTRPFRDVSVTNNLAKDVSIHAIVFRYFRDRQGSDL